MKKHWHLYHNGKQCGMEPNPTRTMLTRMYAWVVQGDTPIHSTQQKRPTHANPYQPGGVAILSHNRVAHWVASMGQDPTGLRWFCWTTYWGRNDLTVRIMAGYWPCKSENGHLSVLQQHWHYQDKLQQENMEHPWSTFWTDLQLLLQEWTTQRHQIIMGLDANEDICTQDIIAFFHEFGMSKSIVVAHRHETPPTQNCSSYPIDGIFTT